MKTLKIIFLLCCIATAVENCSSQKKTMQATSGSDVNLPEPFATPAVRKNSKVIGWPEGKTPTSPEGFVVTKFADKLNSPRWFYSTPNGDLLVSESQTNRKKSANDIIIFRDTDHDGKPELQQTFMKDLNQPLGMLVMNGWFYVGNTDGVYRYHYTPGQTEITEKGEKILDVPA